MDIAQRANVSRSLVSKVLFGDRNVRVSDEKRNQIIQIAKEMGYRPNAAATNLRLGKSHTVVSVSKYNANDHVSSIERGTMEILAIELAVIGFELKLRPYASIDDVIMGIDDLVSTSMCDAVVLWLSDSEGEAAARALEQHGIPFVIVGHHDALHPDWLQVDFDHHAMMRELVKHLLSHGRTRIAYMGYDIAYDYTVRLRDGFTSAVRALTHADVPEEWICRISDDKQSEQVINQWLDLPMDQRPVGLVIGAGNDAWMGVERALAYRGRRIGLAEGEFAVTGQRYENAPLIYGNAMVFDNVHLSRIAYHMADLLRQKLAPDNQALNPIVRILPSLVPAVTMEMPLPCV